MKIKEFLMQDVSWSKIKTKLEVLDHKYAITQRCNDFSQNHPKVLRSLLTLCFTFIVFWQSWTTDDAYHSYIMARHLAEGKGLVYNVGYRVTASTCPLLTLIQAGVYKILHNMIATGIIIGVICSSAAASVIFFKFCTKFRYAIFAFLAMTLSYSFMSFTTSGLENSLLFLLGALFLSCFFKKDEFNAKDLLILAVLLALLAMARMDSVLIFIPMIVTAYFFMTKESFIKRIGIGFLSLLPLILWEVFAVFYYGFPFPNTFYAKLYSGYPTAEYISKGLTYLHLSYMFDILLLVIPIFFLILLFIYKKTKLYSLLAGMLLYLLYIIRIGGDFMVGRHLTFIFFLSLCGICALFQNSETLKIIKVERVYTIFIRNTLMLFPILIIAYIILASHLRLQAKIEFSISGVGSGIVDEKHFYELYGAATIDKIKTWISKQPDRMLDLTEDVLKQINYGRFHGDKGFLDPGYMVYGYAAYYISNFTNMYLTDSIGLMDPFLSRLPGVNCSYWRIGHIIRTIPEGYIETVRTGENRIIDPNLHRYYDKLLIIITGDLFDIERLKTIWNMNIGKYDYLLDNYRKTLKRNPTEDICL